MRICIHRGTKEIGGTCVEIESQSNRIVLDIGLPLDVNDPDAMPLHPVPGFDKSNESLLGVLISHPHQDHYGLAYRLPDDTVFLIGEAAQSILNAADAFTPAGLKLILAYGVRFPAVQLGGYLQRNLANFLKQGDIRFEFKQVLPRRMPRCFGAVHVPSHNSHGPTTLAALGEIGLRQYAR